MVFTPFTLEEATDIAEDFEDLIDTDFGMEQRVYEVIDVAVCPFDENLRAEFIENYSLSKDKESALAFYSGNEYDVIVFAVDIDQQQDLVYITIRIFADQKGITYKYPGPGH